MASYKIKSIIYEYTDEDGVTTDHEIVDEGNIIFAVGDDHGGKFWFATDIPDVKDSSHIVAGCKTFDAHFEEGVTHNHKNTMIGIINDGNHDLVFCAYTTPGFGLAK